MVTISQSFNRHTVRTTHTLRHILACHLKVNTTGVSAFSAMNGEEVSATDLRSLTERCPELAQHLQVDHRSASGT